jgi:hypothetical protein
MFEMARAPATFRQQDMTRAVARRAVHPSPIRYRVDPLDIPVEKTARRLHLTVDEFREKLPELLRRGFPPADPTTGMFFLPAIDKWMASRNGLTTGTGSQRDAKLIIDRIARLGYARLSQSYLPKSRSDF